MGLFSPQDTPLLSLPECHRCGLYRHCNSPKMEPFGSGKRSILIVGEAPGKEDDSQGQPFVGASGQYLRRVLAKLECNLDRCKVTNAIICRPPNNKMDARYLQACRPAFQKTLRDRHYSVVITLGEWALRQVVPDAWARYGGPINRWRGWVIPLLDHGAWLCPTYHPFYINRSGGNPILERTFQSDLAAAINLQWRPPQGFVTLSDLTSRVQIETDGAVNRLHDLATKSGILAFDYETTGLKPDNSEHHIVSCSFCLNGEDPWAAMMGPDELEALGPVLFSPKLRKVASNLKFEERWTLKTFGRGVVGWHWDTMLAAHVLDNRSGITSIKFQSYVRLGIGGWEDGIKKYLEAPDSNRMNRIGSCPRDALLTYNALDSLIEYMVMEQQKSEMGVD